MELTSGFAGSNNVGFTPFIIELICMSHASKYTTSSDVFCRFCAFDFAMDAVKAPNFLPTNSKETAG
jgi:hypothetical protein